MSAYTAQDFTVKHEAATRQTWYRSWKRGLIDGHIRRFVVEGLVPFCKKHGYVFAYSDTEVIQGVSEWAFAHVQIERKKGNGLYRTFKTYSPAGGASEFDWYCQQISSSDWDEFASSWWDTEFLDDSDPGLAQKADLSLLVWNLVYLAGSKAHKNYLQVEAWADYADEELMGSNVLANPSEDTAYGGDRRTL
jgi:hypothetical protein